MTERIPVRSRVGGTTMEDCKFALRLSRVTTLRVLQTLPEWLLSWIGAAESRKYRTSSGQQSPVIRREVKGAESIQHNRSLSPATGPTGQLHERPGAGPDAERQQVEGEAADRAPS